MIPFEYRGGEYRLYFNGLLLYAFLDRYGDKGVMEVLEQDGKEGLEANIWLLCELTRQAELYRRYLGEEPGAVLDYARTLAAVPPGEIPEIRGTVALAVAEGFRRDHPDPDDADPWLQELEAEKNPKKARPGRSIAAWLLGCWASLSKKA